MSESAPQASAPAEPRPALRSPTERDILLMQSCFYVLPQQARTALVEMALSAVVGTGIKVCVPCGLPLEGGDCTCSLDGDV